MNRNYIPLWIWRSLAHAVEEGTEKWQNGVVVAETFEKENEAKWFGAAAAAEAGAAGAFLATFFHWHWVKPFSVSQGRKHK